MIENGILLNTFEKKIACKPDIRILLFLLFYWKDFLLKLK